MNKTHIKKALDRVFEDIQSNFWESDYYLGELHIYPAADEDGKPWILIEGTMQPKDSRYCTPQSITGKYRM